MTRAAPSFTKVLGFALLIHAALAAGLIMRNSKRNNPASPGECRITWTSIPTPAAGQTKSTEPDIQPKPEMEPSRVIEKTKLASPHWPPAVRPAVSAGKGNTGNKYSSRRPAKKSSPVRERPRVSARTVPKPESTPTKSELTAPSNTPATDVPQEKAPISASGADSESISSYHDQIQRLFERKWKHPQGIRFGSEGAPIARIALLIAADGAILSRKLVQPSGNADVDASAMRAAEEVTSVPPLPRELGVERYRVLIKFVLH